ncbi:hypothetical protein M0804_001137 [Polistes exclamans]|nr:hypothetical protein M0804_001137 [Polistes exclamans]
MRPSPPCRGDLRSGCGRSGGGGGGVCDDGGGGGSDGDGDGDGGGGGGGDGDGKREGVEVLATTVTGRWWWRGRRFVVVVVVVVVGSSGGGGDGGGSGGDSNSNSSSGGSSVVDIISFLFNTVQLPRENEAASNGPTGGKKPRGRGLLRSLLCCLGRGRGSSSKSSKTSSLQGDGRGSPPPGTGSPRYLLPPVRHQDMHKKCMVIDLDETLVHSSFKPINNADFVVPVEIDGTVHQVYVLKRPYVDEFLQRMGELYECVLFTASLAKYADPVADLLDRWGVFRARLFRESCVFHRGNYVKDLNKLGRDLQQIIIVDNSPASYIFHPDNAVPVTSWFDDMTDSELLDLIPFFEKLSSVENIYTVLCNSNHPYNQVSTTIQNSPSPGSGSLGAS